MMAAGEEPLQPASRRQRLWRVTLIAVTAVVICAYLDQFTPVFD
jgi:hypothetical protein